MSNEIFFNYYYSSYVKKNELQYLKVGVVHKCSTGGRFRADARFCIKVSKNAENAWKLERLDARLFLLSSRLLRAELILRP